MADAATTITLMSQTPRCVQCEHVIGVYEPAVAVGAGEIRVGSRVQGRLGVSADELYHLACYEAGEAGRAGSLPRQASSS